VPPEHRHTSTRSRLTAAVSWRFRSLAELAAGEPTCSDETADGSAVDVLILANGDTRSAAGERARRIARALTDGGGGVGREVEVDVEIEFREHGRVRDLARFSASARRCRGVVYTIDLAVVPVAAAAARPRRTRLVVDTGDWPSAFLELIGARQPAQTIAVQMEHWVQRNADAIVVRGARHAELINASARGSVHVIPDGVDPELFEPVEDQDLRAQLGLSDVFTVGIQGHFTWYPQLGGGLGWELVEALALLGDDRVHAVLIGDGPGIVELRRLAVDRGVDAQVHVLGRVPLDQLARYLGVCDVCLLTLTNEPSSQVRTTGKLPCYLACGRYILASRVGTAADLLPDEMLLDYHGSWDLTYPERLAARLGALVDDHDRVARGLAMTALAPEFHYDVVARTAADLVLTLLREGD
jgi:glycosyltransferase involved in cell wall biosynthesis